jgi:hypothetical protein
MNTTSQYSCSSNFGLFDTIVLCAAAILLTLPLWTIQKNEPAENAFVAAIDLNHAVYTYAHTCNLSPGTPIGIKELVASHLCPHLSDSYAWDDALMVSFGSSYIRVLGHFPKEGEVYATAYNGDPDSIVRGGATPADDYFHGWFTHPAIPPAPLYPNNPSAIYKSRPHTIMLNPIQK